MAPGMGMGNMGGNGPRMVSGMGPGMGPGMGMGGPGMGMGGPGMGMGGPGMGMERPGMGMGGPGMSMEWARYGYGRGMRGPRMGMGGPRMGMGGPDMDMGGPGMETTGPGFGRGMGPRVGMGRGGMMGGMGDGGMGFGGGYGPMGNEGPGFGNFRDQTEMGGDMMGGGGAMGQGGGLMKRFKAFRPDPAVEGRRIQIEGLPDEVEDSAVTKYFQRYGALDGLGLLEEGWNRAKSQITYKESSMADYALKKKSHTVGGHVVTITRAEPEPEPPGAEEEEEDEHGCTMFTDMPQAGEDHGLSMVRKMKMTLEGALHANEDGTDDGEPSAMNPDEAATRAQMKEAGYSEEEIQTMIDAGCTEMA